MRQRNQSAGPSNSIKVASEAGKQCYSGSVSLLQCLRLTLPRVWLQHEFPSLLGALGSETSAKLLLLNVLGLIPAGEGRGCGNYRSHDE